MEIKSFNYRHIESIIPLLSDNVPYVFPHHPYVYWIMGEYFPTLCFIAQEGDKIEGFICALHSVEKNCIFIWQLVVSDTHRRMGTARLLCSKIIDYAHKNNIKILQMTINDENTASIRFFKKLAKQYGTVLKKITLVGLNEFEDESAYQINI